MYRSKTITVIMPCYNEEEGLKKLLENKPSFIDEVIVVDNASTDATAEIAKSYGATVIFESRKGYGQAYLAGLPKASKDIIALMDGDDTYSMADLEKLLSLMEKENYDFVTGNRYPLADKSAQPIINQYANKLISMAIRLLFNIKLKDSQSGMMVFKRDLLKQINVKDTGMGFSQEIKIKAFIDKNIRCCEERITYQVRAGEVKFRKLKDGMRNLYLVICLWKELKACQPVKLLIV